VFSENFNSATADDKDYKNYFYMQELKQSIVTVFTNLKMVDSV